MLTPQLEGKLVVRYQGVLMQGPKVTKIRLTKHLANRHVNSKRSPDRDLVHLGLHPPAVMPPLLGPHQTKKGGGGLTERKKTLDLSLSERPRPGSNHRWRVLVLPFRP